MRTSDLRLTIIKTFGGKEFYGYEIHKKLISEGATIGIGRLYKVLNQMLRDEWLESRWEKSLRGPKKRLYRLGKRGKEELDTLLMIAIHTIHRAYGEYLLNLPPEKSLFPRISEKVVGKKAGQCNVALVAETSSPMYQRLLSSIRDRLPESKIFVVKPKTVTIKLQLENTIILEGSLENVPFKDNFIDALIVIDLPKIETIQKAAKEWNRATNGSGRIAVLSPEVLFCKSEDPLDIGEFIEKWEHQTYEGRKPGEGNILMKSLKEYFQRIEESNIVHMKLIIAYKPKKET